MSPPIRRLEWIDLFRGLAVLGMIWTHSANTFLEAGLQATPWYGELTYYHGLIAPAFFWISGFVRAHVTQGAIKPAGPALQRLLMVLLIGYLMQFPWLALLSGHISADDWRAGMKVNVLHVMAITGMLLLLAERFGRWRNAVAAVLLVLFAGLETPAENWRTGFMALDQYLNRSQGSLFALFPWVGFGLAGFLTRGLWDGRATRQGAVLLAACLPLALGFVPVAGWIGRAPAFFVERLAWVILAAVLVSCVGGLARIVATTGWLRLAGRESLVLYVAHLIMIHAVPAPRQSLEFGIGKTQPLWMVAVITLILFALSLALGWLNERRKVISRRKQKAADGPLAK